MSKFISLNVLFFSIIVMSGCSSLAEMKEVDRVVNVNSNSSMVNIVRPHIFLGDGVDFEVWDGSLFIGTLEAGSMIQYITTPGKHHFMIDPTQGGDWAHKSIELKKGEKYYIKPNTIPFVGLKIGVAESTDSRISKWDKGLTPLAIDKNKSKEVPQKNIDEAKKYLKSFDK